MKKIIAFAIVLMASVASFAQDHLETAEFSIKAGESKIVTLDMINAEEVYVAFQCDIYLPEGITLNKDGRGIYDISFNAETGRTSASYHILSAAELEDGAVRGNHEYVDLGLSVKWATCNIGAEIPEDYGWHLSWGETTPQESNRYYWDSYKWCNGSSNTQTKYCTSSYYGTVDNKTTLDPEDDAAHVNWGGSWRMPTKAEQDELRSNCTWTWTTLNGVYGRKVTGPNGNSIFLPAAGYRSSGYLYNVGSSGYYWSSSLSEYYSNGAYFLHFDSYDVDWSYTGRNGGRSVRAVCP